VKLAQIVAVASNGVIGRNNQLPWYLPEDLKYFKRTTMGKPVIMGRKTYESIGKPLPGRTNIVITRNPDYQLAGCQVVQTLDAAIEVAEGVCFLEGKEEGIIMGGSEIYKLSLPQTDRLYLTEVHAEVEGDAFFPAIDREQWQEVSREDYQAQGPNPYDYSMVVLERS